MVGDRGVDGPHLESSSTSRSEAALGDEELSTRATNNVVETMAIKDRALRELAESPAVMMGVLELPADNSDMFNIYASSATHRFFAMPPEAMSGKSARELGVPVEVLGLWIERCREAEASRQPVRFEYRYTSDGTAGMPHGAPWLASVVSWIGPGEEGRARFSYVTEDITERKHAEEQLRDRELHVRLAMTSSLAIAFEWDLRLDRVRRLASVEEALPETVNAHDKLVNVARVVHVEDRAVFFRNVFAATASEDGTYRSQYRIVRPGGEVRWLSETGRVEFDRVHRPLRLLGVAQDITEHKRAEQELRDAHRRKDEFIAVLAHELRNPLAPVRTAVEILRRLGPYEARVVRAHQVIDRQVTHMARLIDDLLDVSRIARGRMMLQRVPCDVAAIARQTAEDYRVSLEAAGLTLATDASGSSGDALWVDGDPSRLAQMVGNLLHNAGRFTPKGGRIEVISRIDLKQRIVEVLVRDTGVGIDSALLPRLFDPFAQAEQGLARTAGGLGLGLALTKGLAELHGGSVSAESAGPGRGSTFTLRLPWRASLPVPPARAVEPRQPGAARRVLIVEDNPDAAETLGELLELSGCIVELAHDGTSALEAVSIFQPDAVVCDIGLPGDLDGYGVARALRGQPAYAQTKLIALSGYANEDARRRSRLAGFDAHLAKPADLDALAKALDGPAARWSDPSP